MENPSSLSLDRHQGQDMLAERDTTRDTTLYEAPVLKMSEIQSGMGELGMRMPKKDMELPTPERTTLMYQCLLRMISPTQYRSFKKAEEDILARLQHPEMHTVSIHNVLVNEFMKKLLHSIGHYDFGMKDLLFPDPKRQARILSALLNYCKYTKDVNILFAPIARKLKQEADAVLDLMEKISEYEQERERIMMERHLDSERVKEIEEENTVLESKIKELEGSIKEVERSIAGLRNEKSAIKDRFSTTYYQSVSLEIEAKSLSTRANFNPQREHELIESLTAAYNEQALVQKDLDDKVLDCSEKIKNLTDIEQVHLEAIEHLRHLVELIKEFSNHREEGKTAVDEYSRVSIELKQIKNKKSQKKAEIRTLELKIERYSNLMKQMKQNNQLQLETHKKDIEEAELSMQKKNNEISQIEAIIVQIQEKAKHDEMKHNTQYELMQFKYTAIQKKIQELLHFIHQYAQR
ncbi:Nuf2 family-domain-containing protein [Spinellus fusiger]|nr:Nuf2 family-domain-containing protein [Spinellus fusiger]